MNSLDLIEIVEIIHKQLELENISRNNKNMYKMYLKLWIDSYKNCQMTFGSISSVLDHRIKDLKKTLIGSYFISSY